jgi:hypothetical protein
MVRTKGTRIMSFLLLVYVIFVLACTMPVAAFTSMSDDFSSNSGNWTYVGDAHRSGGRLEIVPASPDMVGIAWLKQDVRYPFVVEFKAQTSSSGEGMVFMFHHDKSYTPAGGSKLGFQPASGNADGWGVELDTQTSYGDDASAPHISLIHYSTDSDFWKMDTSHNFNDGKWHTYKITIEWSTITLVFDGKQIWQFSDYSFKAAGTGMGFSAASGAGGGSFKVDDFKLQAPGEAELMYWVTFGVTIAIIVFSIFGGIVIYASVKWRGILKKYAQPGVDYRAYQIPTQLQKQIVVAAKQSPDPGLRELYSGYRKCSWGMGVAGFLMMAAIIGTLFMPPMLVLTLGIVLMVVFMSIFGIAGYLAVKRGKPFLAIMGLKMGYFQPAQGGYQQPQYNYQQPPGGYQQPPMGPQQPPARPPQREYPHPPHQQQPMGYQQPPAPPPQTPSWRQSGLPPPKELTK